MFLCVNIQAQDRSAGRQVRRPCPDTARSGAPVLGAVVETKRRLVQGRSRSARLDTEHDCTAEHRTVKQSCHRHVARTRTFAINYYMPDCLCIPKHQMACNLHVTRNSAVKLSKCKPSMSQSHHLLRRHFSSRCQMPRHLCASNSQRDAIIS